MTPDNRDWDISVAAASAAAIDWKDLFDRIPDESLILQFAASYKDSTGPLIQRLEESIQQQDDNLVESNAHAVKGSAANLGAIRLAKAAWQLEMAAREQKRADYRLCFQHIQTEYIRLMDLLSHTDWIALLKLS